MKLLSDARHCVLDERRFRRLSTSKLFPFRTRGGARFYSSFRVVVVVVVAVRDADVRESKLGRVKRFTGATSSWLEIIVNNINYGKKSRGDKYSVCVRVSSI